MSILMMQFKIITMSILMNWKIRSHIGRGLHLVAQVGEHHALLFVMVNSTNKKVQVIMGCVLARGDINSQFIMANTMENICYRRIESVTNTNLFLIIQAQTVKPKPMGSKFWHKETEKLDRILMHKGNLE